MDQGNFALEPAKANVSAARPSPPEFHEPPVIEIVLRGRNGGEQPATPSHGSFGRPRFRHIELESTRGARLVVKIPSDGELPGWVMPAVEKMAERLTLPENWNSYGARPIDPAALASALLLLDQIMHATTPAPLVIPTSRGGIQLEWHMRGIDLEVEAISPSRVNVFYEDQVDRIEWEKELSSDLAPLVGALAELSHRG